MIVLVSGMFGDDEHIRTVSYLPPQLLCVFLSFALPRFGLVFSVLCLPLQCLSGLSGLSGLFGMSVQFLIVWLCCPES